MKAWTTWLGIASTLALVGVTCSADAFAAAGPCGAAGEACGCGVDGSACVSAASAGVLPASTSTQEALVAACSGTAGSALCARSASSLSSAEASCRLRMQQLGVCAGPGGDTVAGLPRVQGDGATFGSVPRANVSRARAVPPGSSRGFQFKSSQLGGFRSTALAPLLASMSAPGPLPTTGPSSTLFAGITTPRGLGAGNSGAEDIVLSCGEYVYKRFYDYEQIVLAARRALPNWNLAWSALLPLSDTRSPLRGYVSQSSFASALEAPLQAALDARANGLLVPVQPSEVALASFPRNALFSALPSTMTALAAMPGVSRATVDAISAALTAGKKPFWTRPSSVRPGDELAEEWVAHLREESIQGGVAGYRPEYALALSSPEAAAFNTQRAARFGEKLGSAAEVTQALFCLEHGELESCSSDPHDLIAELAGRYARRNDQPGPIPELRGPLDDVAYGLDPFRARQRVQELAVVSAVLADAEMLTAPFGPSTTRAQFLAVADRVRARLFAPPAPVLSPVVSSTTTRLATSLNLRAGALKSTTISIASVTKPLPTVRFSSLTVASLATLGSDQIAALAAISPADARTLPQDVLMALPTATLERLALDPVLGKTIARTMNLSDTAARRDALKKAKSALDKDMASILLDEWNRDELHGCLEVPRDSSALFPTPNRCDWSFELSVRRMMNLFAAYEEAEFDRCVKATGDSFGSAARVMMDPSVSLRGPDGRLSVDLLNVALDARSPVIRLPNGGTMRLGNFRTPLLDGDLQRKKFYPTGWRGPSFCGFGVRPGLVQPQNAQRQLDDCFGSVAVGAPSLGVSIPGIFGRVGAIPRFANALTLADFVNHMDLPDDWGEFQVQAMNASLAGLRAELGNLPTIALELPEFPLPSIAGLQGVVDATLTCSRSADGRAMSPTATRALSGLKLGREKSDGESYGDPDWFAASWGYRWGWGVWPELRQPTPEDNRTAKGGNSCLDPLRLLAGFGGQAVATANADFTALFGLLRARVLLATVSVSARLTPPGVTATALPNGLPDGVHASAHVEVLGREVLGSGGAPAGTLSGFVLDFAGPESKLGTSVVVPVGPFALDFAGSAVIQAGFKHGLDFRPPVVRSLPTSVADLTRVPSISFAAKAFVEPYVNVDATGSAALSLGIGSAGGRVTVRVLGLAVPAGMEASVNTTDMKLRMQETADLKLATLKGKVEAFATLGVDPFSTSWYWTLFDWDGYERTIPIFHRAEAPVDLSKVMKRLAGPMQISSKDLD